MATAPRINFFDGSGSTTSFVVTTNLFNVILTGTVDDNTVDIQIDLNGSGFVSDPSLVGLTVPDFTVPNLSSYPDGLPLERGENIIRLRAIDLSGAVSPVSQAVITVVSAADFELFEPPPTGVQLRRKATSVELQWVDTGGTAIGFNVYAATGEGGTISGYLRVNANLIPAGSPTSVTQEEFPVTDISYDFTDSENYDLHIIAKTVDPVSGLDVEQKAYNTIPLVGSPSYRYTVGLSTLVTTKRYTFEHDREASLGSGILNNDVFSSVLPDDPLYYVMTAVYFDANNGQLQESRYSPELTGSPLPLNTVVRGIRIRDQRIVAQDYIAQVQKKEPTLALIPGSTEREVHIEPFSNEIQKAYFLADFVHRAKSFQALLAIDDPGLTGISVPVAQSQYKQNLRTALSVTDDTAVQALIDAAFDSLAANVGVPRGGSKASQVVQTFFTTMKPVKDLVVVQGAVVSSSTNASAPRFIAKGRAIIPAASADSFYNANRRRYEIRVQMIADAPGSTGNVPATALDTVVSGASGLLTTNEFAADFGLDRQSNLELAEVGMLAVSSVDTGTLGGMQRVAIGSPNVLDVRVVMAGDPEMMRDYDPLRQKHIGGKVDVFVKGTNERTIAESFAFQFDVARNIRFDVVDPVNLMFRARDSRLSPSNPIREMLFNPGQGYGLRNHSVLPTAEYDLTGVILIDYRTIKLSSFISQPDTSFDDFIEGDYRYRSNNKFVATVQPVRRISSVAGTVSGVLDPVLGYALYKTEDPLLEGESTAAENYVMINQVGNTPSGDSISVNDEQHVLIGQFQEALDSVGVNSFTLKVYSQDRTIQYNGPDAFSPDYLVVAGSQTTPLKIVRTTRSTIPSGTTISVDYEHDENFAVTYVVNDVLQVLQARYGKMRHITADVLVKQAVENPLAAEMTVKLLPNADQPTTDQSLRTGISVLLDSKKTGQSVHQSDITTRVEAATGVDYVVQPYARLTLRDGALRIRDMVLSDYDELSSLSQFNNAVYLLTQELPFATMDGGGLVTDHHGVYKDELIMAESTDLISVGSAPNQFFIIGNQGAVIPGYSDDATLSALVPAAGITAERISRTANRVVVSLDHGASPPDLPSAHSFTATYMVSGDRGSKDLSTTGIEYLTPGDLVVTYATAS
jgi:hypothetical protein